MAKKWINKENFKKTQQNAEKELEKGGFREGFFPYGMVNRSVETGTYIIRLLPAMKDDIPEDFYRVIHFHSFPIGSDWYFFTCLQTYDENCPICEVSKKLYMGDSSDKDLAKKLYRQTKRICNIYVVSDPRDAAREEDKKLTGKVCKFEYKKQIHAKFTKAMSNDSELGVGTGIIDPSKDGYNFILKVTEKITGLDRYPSYEDSEFSRRPSPLADTDKAIERILDQVYCLEDLVKEQRPKLDSIYSALDKLGLLDLCNVSEKEYKKNKKKEMQQKLDDVFGPEKSEEKKDELPEKESSNVASSDSSLEDDDIKFLEDLDLDDDIPF